MKKDKPCTAGKKPMMKKAKPSKMGYGKKKK